MARGKGVELNWYSRSTDANFTSIPLEVSNMFVGENETNPLYLPDSSLFHFSLCHALVTIASGDCGFGCTECSRHRSKHPRSTRTTARWENEVHGYEGNGKTGLFTLLHRRAQQSYPNRSRKDLEGTQGQS